LGTKTLGYFDWIAKDTKKIKPEVTLLG
jgi:hypothetical protein